MDESAFVCKKNSKFRFRNMDTQVADIILMRNAELYLISAEAGAQLGKANALQRLNELRVARGATPKTSSGDELLEDIYLERRLELWGEGFGVVDIIRLQKSVERKEWPQTESDYVEYSWIDGDGVSHTRKIQPQGHRIVTFPDGSLFSPIQNTIFSESPRQKNLPTGIFIRTIRDLLSINNLKYEH